MFAGVSELIEFGAGGVGEFGGRSAEGLTEVKVVVGRGEDGSGTASEIAEGAVRVDPEIIDDGVHGEGKGVLKFAFGLEHDFVNHAEGFLLAGGVDNEAHAAAGHAAEHPKSPEVVAEFLRDAGDEGFGEMVGGPGDDGLKGAAEVLGGEATEGANVALAEGLDDLIEQLERFLAALPFGLGAEKVFFGDHLEDGADVLSHAAVDEDEGVGECLAGLERDFIGRKNMVLGHEPATGNAVFGVGLADDLAFDEFDAGPNAAGVLPAAAGAADPFAEDGAGENEAAFAFGEFTGERLGLAGGAHAGADKGGEEVGGNGEAGAFRDVVDGGNHFQSASRSGDLREEIGEGFAGALDARRDDSGGDDGGFEQAEVVLGEVENFGERADLSGGFQVDAGEAQDGLVDDAEVGFDGRFGGIIAAMDGEIDGDVDHAGSLGEVHAEEENIGPGGVGEVHADGGAFAEDGEEVVVLLEEFGANTQRVIGGVPHAEHPLVTADGADGFADLVGEGLEGELMVGGGEGGGDAIGGAVLILDVEEGVDGFLELAGEEVLVSVERDGAGGVGGEFFGEVKAVNRLQEKDGANAVIEVVGLAAEGIEFRTLGEERGRLERGTSLGKGAVADRGILRCDQGNEHGQFWEMNV